MSELRHYGVKGMKWGVRKSEYKAMSRQERKKTKDEYKADKKWMKKSVSGNVYRKAWSKEVDDFNANLPSMNKKLGPNKTREQYDQAYRKEMNRLLNKSMKELIESDVSPSKRYKVEMLMDETLSMPYMARIDNKEKTARVYGYMG